MMYNLMIKRIQMSLSKVRKTVIINRAVSGSGKTTISRCMAETVKVAGLSTAIHSTDGFVLGSYPIILS